MTKRQRITVIVTAATAINLGWMATASLVWCWGTGRVFEWPCLQWFHAVNAGWWYSNWWCKLWIIIGALVPTVILLFILTVRLKIEQSYRKRPDIYGSTNFASRREMAGRDIKHAQEPF